MDGWSPTGRPPVHVARTQALGYLLRVVKRLPASVQERVVAGLLDGDGPMPAFADMLRTVEVAHGLPPRRRWQQRLLAQEPELARVRVETVVTTQAPARLHARVYLPPVGRAQPGVALVWVHGGGFFLGDLDGPDPHWVSLAVAARGVAVVAVDYRLCLNGVHYPAPLEDVARGWQWATEHADRLGVEPGHLHLGGASAGASLALATALRLRDAGRPLPASLTLAYPLLYVDSPAPTPDAAAVLPFLDPGALNEEVSRGSFLNYLGTTAVDDPYGVPATGPADGLPRTLVVTCGRDYLRLHSEAYSDKLRVAGVDARHDVLRDAPHGVLDVPASDDGNLVVDRLMSWISRSDAEQRRGPASPVT